MKLKYSVIKQIIATAVLAGTALAGSATAASASTHHSVEWYDVHTCASFHSWKHTHKQSTFKVMVQRSKQADEFIKDDVNGLSKHRNSQWQKFVQEDCDTLNGYGL